MKKIKQPDLLAAQGGLSCIDLGNGMMQINSSLVDLMHKSTITTKELDGFDTQTGSAKYKYVTQANPQYRGSLVPTNERIFIQCMVFAGVLSLATGCSIVHFLKKGY